MRKLLLILSFLLITSHASAGVVSYEALVTMDDLTLTWLNTNFANLVNGLNSPDGALIRAGTISSDSLTDNANPVLRWKDGFNNFVITGLLPPTSASLVSITTTGRALINGYYVQKDATSHTYTASKDTYVDISQTGVYTYAEVANDAAEPSTTANSIRLAKVVTDGTTVSSVEDKRVTSIDIGNKDDRTVVGMNLIAVSPDCYYAGLVTVDAGVCYVGSTRVNKISQTTLKLSDANSWHDGVADAGANTWWYVGADTLGNVKLLGANPPDYNDTDGTTAGDQKYYWYDTVNSKYYRVLGVFRTDTSQRVSGDFLNYGNTYYYTTVPSIYVNSTGNNQLNFVDISAYVPTDTVSRDAKFSVQAGAARTLFLAPYVPNMKTEPDIANYPGCVGVYVNTANLKGNVGWVPIYNISNDNVVVKAATDNTTNKPTLSINAYRVNFRD